MQIGKKTDDRLLRKSEAYPIVPGHEISGVIHTMGAKAKEESDLSEGDRVVVYPWIGCDNCTRCSAGDHYLCQNTNELGFCKDGGYAEFVLVQHYRFALKLPDKIPFELGALLPCGGVTAYSALKKCSSVAARVSKWQDGRVYVMVIGLGGLGRWALKLLPHTLKGFELHVTGVDVTLTKAQEARDDCGNIDEVFVMAQDETPQKMAEQYTKEFKHQPNIIVDFVNSTNTFSFGAAILGRAGVKVMVGLHGGLGELALPLAVLSECAHVASFVGSLQDVKELIQLVDEQRVEPPHMVTFRLCDATQALKKLEEGKVNGRAVLVADDGGCQ